MPLNWLPTENLFLKNLYFTVFPTNFMKYHKNDTLQGKLHLYKCHQFNENKLES